MLQPNAASRIGTRPSGPPCPDAALRGRWGGSPGSSRVCLGCAARVLQRPGPSVVGPSGGPPEEKAQSVKEGRSCYTSELLAGAEESPRQELRVSGEEQGDRRSAVSPAAHVRRARAARERRGARVLGSRADA